MCFMGNHFFLTTLKVVKTNIVCELGKTNLIHLERQHKKTQLVGQKRHLILALLRLHIKAKFHNNKKKRV